MSEVNPQGEFPRGINFSIVNSSLSLEIFISIPWNANTCSQINRSETLRIESIQMMSIHRCILFCDTYRRPLKLAFVVMLHPNWQDAIDLLVTLIHILRLLTNNKCLMYHCYKYKSFSNLHLAWIPRLKRASRVDRVCRRLSGAADDIFVTRVYDARKGGKPRKLSEKEALWITCK